MNDAAYETEKARVIACLDLWMGRLGLHGNEWRFTTRFLREPFTNEEHCGGDVTVDSGYLNVEMRLFLPALAGMNDWQLDETIAHELMHVITEDAIRFLPDEAEAHLARERVCQRLARQFVAAYRVDEDDPRQPADEDMRDVEPETCRGCGRAIFRDFFHYCTAAPLTDWARVCSVCNTIVPHGSEHACTAVKVGEY